MKLAYRIAVYTLFAMTLLLNLLSWTWNGFSDIYRDAVFGYASFPLRSLSGMAEGSVGEILLCVGLGLILFSLLAAAGLLIRLAKGKKASWQVLYFKCFLLLLAVVSLIMTLNCFILYHCSSLERLYYPDAEGREYDLEELKELRNRIVLQVNEMSSLFERDEDENLIYAPGMEEMKKKAAGSVKALEGSISQLSGAYNMPKELRFSAFMSQQRMEGYYFPFSMEANINGDMSEILKPAAMCHELAHTKGFMYEDEANFIAYLACVSSDDPYFQYSGYLCVLNYVDNDFYRALGSREAYDAYPAISERVRRDSRFLTDGGKKKMEEEAWLPTDQVEKAAESFISGNLTANGIREGSLSYGKVVRLLLDHDEAALHAGP